VSAEEGWLDPYSFLAHAGGGRDALSIAGADAVAADAEEGAVAPVVDARGVLALGLSPNIKAGESVSAAIPGLSLSEGDPGLVSSMSCSMLDG
jgi:hypothetical protein